MCVKTNTHAAAQPPPRQTTHQRSKPADPSATRHPPAPRQRPAPRTAMTTACQPIEGYKTRDCMRQPPLTRGISAAPRSTALCAARRSTRTAVRPALMMPKGAYTGRTRSLARAAAAFNRGCCVDRPLRAAPRYLWAPAARPATVTEHSNQIAQFQLDLALVALDVHTNPRPLRCLQANARIRQ